MSGKQDPFDPERFRLRLVPTEKPPKPVRSPFGRVWLPQLTDRKWDFVYPARTRLWLLLLIKSREGRQQVRLTNHLVSEIGLDRREKRRSLRALEQAGLVGVFRQGSEAPLVSVAPDEASQKWPPGVAHLATGCRTFGPPGPERNSILISTASSSLKNHIGELAKFETPNAPLDPRPPIPETTRYAVLKRAGGTCEQCACDAPLELHHLHYNTQGEETPDDLAALCRDCHESRHRDNLGEYWTDPVALRHYWFGQD